MIRALTIASATLLVLYAAACLLAWALQARLIYPAPQERVAPTGDYRAIMLDTADGLSIRSFYRPADPAKPTLVYFHGNGSSLAGAMAANAALTERGYGALLVNYRGYGGNPGEPGEEGFYKDGRAAMDWLKAQGLTSKDIVLIGNSIGGGTAVQMAREYGAKALMLSAPFTSLPDVAAEKARWLPVRLLLRDRFNNLSKIGSLPMPVLIQHGSADTLIPLAHGRLLAEAAQDATLQVIEGGGHDIAFQPETQSARLQWVEAL